MQKFGSGGSVNQEIKKKMPNGDNLYPLLFVLYEAYLC